MSDSKIIIAHRGASGCLPEHTLPAYALAYGLGADYIEADVNVTRDGVPVVIHDMYLDSDTDVAELFPSRAREDGRYYVVDFTLAEIKQLSVVERFDPKTKEVIYPNRFPIGNCNKGCFRVPTFVEEIELIQGLNKSTGKIVGIYPELKHPAFYEENGFDIGKIVLDCLDAYGLNTSDAKCYIQCFDAPYLEAFKERLEPKCKLVQLVGPQEWPDCVNNNVAYMLTKSGLAEVAQYADVLSPSVDQIFGEIESLVDDAHDAGLEVHPYTVRKDDLPPFANSAEELLNMILYDKKCDGIFTDFTDIGVKVLR